MSPIIRLEVDPHFEIIIDSGEIHKPTDFFRIGILDLARLVRLYKGGDRKVGRKRQLIGRYDGFPTTEETYCIADLSANKGRLRYDGVVSIDRIIVRRFGVGRLVKREVKYEIIAYICHNYKPLDLKLLVVSDDPPFTTSIKTSSLSTVLPVLIRIPTSCVSCWSR